MATQLFPEHELYLLENWADAVQLEASIDSVRDTYKACLKMVLDRVAAEHMDFELRGFHLGYPRDYRMNIGVGKSTWPSKWPKWPSGFWLSNLWLENLTSEDEERPLAWIYIAPDKPGFSLDRAVDALSKEAEKRLPREQADAIEAVSKKSEAWVAWPLPEPRRKLLELLRTDEAKGFIDGMVEHFEIMMQFVPVMNKIFENGKPRHR